MKYLNYIVAILVILVNLYFLPYTFILLKNDYGIGTGIWLLPLMINLCLITAMLAFKQRFNNNWRIFVVNLLGIFFAYPLLFLLLTTPKMD